MAPPSGFNANPSWRGVKYLPPITAGLLNFHQNLENVWVFLERFVPLLDKNCAFMLLKYYVIWFEYSLLKQFIFVFLDYYK